MESIEKDDTLSLSEIQKSEVRDRTNSYRRELTRKIRELYRVLYLPTKDDLEEIDIGMPTFGLSSPYLNKEVYGKLVDEKIAVKLDPYYLKNKYMKDNDYVSTNKLLELFYNTPGELMISSETELLDSIRRGVKDGIFGWGILENGKPICKHFEEDFSPEIGEAYVLIQPTICEKEKRYHLLNYKSRLIKLEV